MLRPPGARNHLLTASMEMMFSTQNVFIFPTSLLFGFTILSLVNNFKIAIVWMENYRLLLF